MNYRPTACNIELTTLCPLGCPQCYCSLEGGRSIDPEVAISRIHEAAALGVKLMHLSGGETMCYPFLYDLIYTGSQLGIQMDIATSGFGISANSVRKLIDSGVGRIYISLNGSNELINSVTRDGYDFAINALNVLQREGFTSTYINWVMHTNNVEDFTNIIRLAEVYNVSGIVVLAFKPDSKHDLPSYPSGEQMRNIANIIRNNKSSVSIEIETCFSPLLALVNDTKFLGNINRGLHKGCGAGRFSYSINVEGKFSPCRHLDFFEDYPSAEEYWANSSVLTILRSIESDTREPCSECKFKSYCRHCLAINSKLHNELYIGFDLCTLGRDA